MGAALLVGCAALLMRVGEGAPRPKPTWQRVDIPRRATKEDKARMEQRQVLELLPAPKSLTPDAPPPPPRPRDPVLAALGGGNQKGAFVFEANAMRHSPLGELLIECITSRDDGAGLRRLREQSGIDPLTQLDRIAVTDDMVMFTGDFKSLKLDNARGEPQQFGDNARLVELTRRDGGTRGTLGIWNDQMIIAGKDPEQVKQTLERIEGKRPMEPGGLTDSQAYGEIYGVLSPELLEEMVGEENPELAERLGQVAQRVELHVDTTGDVGVSARVQASNAAESKEVAKALGAAMSVARMKAQADGRTDMAELLDMGKVISDENGFRLEAGVPQPWLEKALKQCVERNKKRLAERAEETPVAPSSVEGPATAPPK